MDRREKLVLGLLLLFLTSSGVRCASKSMAPSSAETIVTGAGSSRGEEQKQEFVDRGVDAPDTFAVERKKQAPLDLAQLSESVGEAKELSEEALRNIEARGRKNDASKESARRELRNFSESTTADVERERTATSDERGRRARPEPRPDAPGPSGELQMVQPEEGEAGGVEGGVVGGVLGGAVAKTEPPPPPPAKKPAEKDKKGKESGDADIPKPVVPLIQRAPATGKILVHGESGRLEAIIPRAVRVLAYVEGPRARTVVDYVFENPHGQRLEGTFYYPLPGDASPAGFAMFEGTKRVDGESMFQSLDLLPDLGKEMIDPLSLEETAPSRRAKQTVDWGSRKDARVVEQKRAREVYEEIVRSEIDPALLEWSGSSTFQARVFPLEPHSLKRLVVAYEQPLLFDGARFRYGYTLPVEPAIKAREAVVFVDRRHGKIAEAPQGAEEKKLERWSRFDLSRPAAGAAITVAVEPASAAQIVLRGRDPAGLPGDSFYAEVRPALVRGDESKTGRALIFVDTSLSSEDDNAHARRAKMIEALLERDDTIREYAVALFDLRVRWLHSIGWRANSADNRRQTIRDLGRIYLEGATSFAAVLDELERQRKWAVDGEKTTVFLMSDGEITWGMDKIEGLAARRPVLRDVRWITYRFGEAPINRALFDMLSAQTRGRTISLLSEAEADAAAIAHRAEPAVLEGVKVKGATAVDLVVAGEPKLIFPGQTLQIAGRLPSGGSGVLSLVIRTGSSMSAIDVPLGESDAQDTFAPRAWADLHTKRLIALDDVRFDRMVVALSQHYRLANARASFLVLDREEQAEQFNLRDENVDLANLEDLRKREEDQRRDRLLGIALDEISKEGREVIDVLKRRTDGVPPLLDPQPLVEAPFAGGGERLQAELDYRRERAKEKQDFLMYERIARARALAGDTAGAVRALSSAVEVSPRDGEAMRLVGYALLGLAQYDVAAELFERLRLNRPFEPEAFLEEALALDAAGRYWEAARNYELLLSKPWRRHQEESRVTATYHYGRMLDALLATGALDKDAAVVRARLTSLSVGTPIDLQLTTFWSTDSIDVDLWVYEPNGEKCFYSHRETTLGGRLFWDVTDGLGPELYHAARVTPGQYDTLVHFYGSRAPRLRAPTAMLMVVDRGLFSEKARDRRFQMRMLPKKDAVLLLRTDVFEAAAR